MPKFFATKLMLSQISSILLGCNEIISGFNLLLFSKIALTSLRLTAQTSHWAWVKDNIRF